MQSQRSLPLRTLVTLLVTLAIVLPLAACSWPPSIVGVVPVVPPGSASLSVLVSSGNTAAQEAPSIDVSNFVGQPFRFGIHPPLGATGVFAVAVAAMDRNGCLINSAAGEIELGAADNDGFVYGRPERTLQLTLEPGPSDYATNCLNQRPAVRAFAQNEDDPTLATISGWGFAPGVSVTLDDIPGTGVVRKDAAHVEAHFAISPSPSGLRQATLKVRNPDGSSADKVVTVYSIMFAPRDRNTYTLDANLEPVAIALADVHGDGPVDVVVSGLRASTSGFVAVFRNQGGGKLAATPQVLELPDTVDDIQLADMDRDGAVDVVGISATAGLLIIALNDGQGNFTANNAFALNLPAGTAATTLAVGNVLGDVYPDVVVASSANPLSTAALLFYQGGSTGIGFVGGLDQGLTLFGNMLIRDLDVDGRDDIVYVQTTPGALPNQLVSNLRTVQSDGMGSFTYGPTLSTASGAYAQVAAIDLDGDSLLDLVSSGVFTPSQLSGKLLSAYINQGGANYSAGRVEYPTQSQPFAMAVADFNRDGRSDLVVSHILKEGQGHVSTLLNLGGGQGFAGAAAQPSYQIGYGDNYVATSDLSGDGKADFAIVSRGVPKIKQPAQLQVFLNTSL